MSDTPDRTCYELLVGRHLSPATLATFPVALRPTAVPRNTVRRLRVGADSDIAEVVRRLTERDVELLGIRRCWQEPARPLEQPATWAVSPEDGWGVVIPLPVWPAAGGAPREHRPGHDDAGSVVPLTGNGPDRAAGRGRRRRRGAARG